MKTAFAGRRVLVTGASGFLGTHLTRRLAREGAEVHAVSRVARQPSAFVSRWWQADLAGADAVADLLDAVNPGFVFHLSGHVTAVPDLDAVLPAFQSLIASTVNLLTAVTRRRTARLVLAGSLTEPAGMPTRDVPGSPYTAAKWAATMFGRMFQALYDAPVVVTQLAYTYGPGQSRHRLIPYVIESLLRGDPPRLGGGGLRADWTYVDDMVAGLLAAAAADDAVGRLVDLGSGSLVPVRDVVGHIARLSGADVKPLFGAVPDRPRESFRPALIEHTRALIGWQATTALEQGLRRTLDWYRSQ